MGSRTERLLLEDAGEYGFTGIKVDTGSAYGFHRGHDAGDIILGKPSIMPSPEEGVEDFIASDLYVIEEKYRSTDTDHSFQIDREKTEDMVEFAEAIGATPLLAARWSTQLDLDCEATHYIQDIREVENFRDGDGKSFSISPSKVIGVYQTTEEYFSEVKVGGI